ncbi:unnamed protein product [Rotaria socialis]|uniref:Uncharacterized protein n=1 Tax=Rotaria socialis TaxID=392032 RepID=A0A818E5I1_9BILA|nr:unnamed protein product [Rotaria socialis]CAF3451102.1 unnamed protein product [Rotaria socialis]CAF3707215.1 unnamed protein product [Rotaria socialis]
MASPNEFDQYLSPLGSYNGKHFETYDDMATWIFQHALSRSNLEKDPVLAYLMYSPDPILSLPSTRSIERPEFDCNRVDESIDMWLEPSEQSSPPPPSEIHFEPINNSSNDSFNVGFGMSKVIYDTPNIELESMRDCDQRSLQESDENQESSQLDEWSILDPNSGRLRRPLLHEFLRQLLDNEKYSNIATYIDREQGIFKFHQKKVAAQLWQHAKGRNSDSVMTYEKLARAIRYYYSGGIIRPTPGRFTFRFGSSSGIILAFNKRSPTEIAEAIKSFNLALISNELVQHLIQYIPNNNEIDALRQSPIDKEQLSPTDRLMFEIIQIPFYMERLNTLKFKLTFADNCDTLNKQMHIINEACIFLYQSKHIKILLEIILSALNHLNSTPTNRILTLDDLSKIYDLKTSKTRTPIMNIVSKISIDRHPEILDLKQNYNLIFSASKIDLVLTRSEIEQMKNQSEEIKLWMNKFDKNAMIQVNIIQVLPTGNRIESL